MRKYHVCLADDCCTYEERQQQRKQAAEQKSQATAKNTTSAMKTISHPNNLEWLSEPLPNVQEIPKECWILVWIVKDDKLSTIKLIHPWEDELNPLRWCDGNGYPLGGLCYPDLKVKHWAWVISP